MPSLISKCQRCGVSWEHPPRSRKPRFCSKLCANRRRGDDLIERFNNSVDRTQGPESCWLWLGTKDKNGYGKLHHFLLGDIRAHRLALVLHLGLTPTDLAPEQMVLHSCDNPTCCNPQHLRLGSALDNSNDKVRRNRHAYGSRINTAKLTEVEVLEARSLYASGTTLRELCAKFGLAKSSMHSLVKGKSWKSVIAVTALLLCMGSLPVNAQSHAFIKPDLTKREVIKPSEPGLNKQLAPVDLKALEKNLPPKIDKTFLGLSAIYATGVVADFWTTKSAIDRGGREGNPLFARNGGRSVSYGLNAAVSGGIWVTAYLLQRSGAKKFARGLLVFGSAWRFGAAIHNHGVRR